MFTVILRPHSNALVDVIFEAVQCQMLQNSNGRYKIWMRKCFRFAFRNGVVAKYSSQLHRSRRREIEGSICVRTNYSLYAHIYAKHYPPPQLATPP
jgi:hypothetical protein